MNTKQVLYNALKSQLDIKKQAHEVYNDTITKPACHELITNIRTFLSTIAPIDDSMEINLNNRSLTVKTDNDSYSSRVEIVLNQIWDNDKKVNSAELEWSSSSYNLYNKKHKLTHINVLSSLANNLELISDKFYNEWKIEWSKIWDNDYSIEKEYTDLQYALNNLANEIHVDSVDSMRKIGFEIKQFKPQYSLDWDYNNDERNYKIVTSPKSIRLQTGRSQWESCHVEGFKVLSKKGNKYNVEVIRSGHVYNYDVLEKKFEMFVNEVAEWEYKQYDKQKENVERRFAERVK